MKIYEKYLFHECLLKVLQVFLSIRCNCIIHGIIHSFFRFILFLHITNTYEKKQCFRFTVSDLRKEGMVINL